MFSLPPYEVGIDWKENIWVLMKQNTYLSFGECPLRNMELCDLKIYKKNPAYGRHGISRPMWIVATIFFFPLA